MNQKAHLIFIHGLANKPPKNDLKRIWLEALAEHREANPGFDLGAVGVRSTLVYWADLFFDKPLPTNNYERNSEELSDSVAEDIVLASDAWMIAMLKRFPMDENSIFKDATIDDGTIGQDYERIPIPWPVKKQMIRHFLQEAHDYLFNIDNIRTKIRERVIDAINQVKKDEQIVLVGHSQGAIIAYDVLTGVHDCPIVDGLMTLGSPLGIDEVQDKLTWSRDNGFPNKLKGNWVNVYDEFDAVACLDPKHTNDFKKKWCKYSY